MVRTKLLSVLLLLIALPQSMEAEPKVLPPGKEPDPKTPGAAPIDNKNAEHPAGVAQNKTTDEKEKKEREQTTVLEEELTRDGENGANITTMLPNNAGNGENGGTGTTLMQPNNAGNGENGTTLMQPSNTENGGNGTTPMQPNNIENGGNGTTPMQPNNIENGGNGTTPMQPNNIENGGNGTTPKQSNNTENGGNGTTTMQPNNIGNGGNGTTPMQPNNTQTVTVSTGKVEVTDNGTAETATLSYRTSNIIDLITYKSSEERELDNGGYRISLPGEESKGIRHVHAHDGFHNIKREPIWEHWNEALALRQNGNT